MAGVAPQQAQGAQDGAFQGLAADGVCHDGGRRAGGVVAGGVTVGDWAARAAMAKVPSAEFTRPKGAEGRTAPQPLESGVTSPGLPSSAGPGSGAYIWATPDTHALPGARLGAPRGSTASPG